MTTDKATSTEEQNLSGVEQIKRGSNYLRGRIKQDLHDPSKSHFDEAELQLLKHHGTYQQDDRDLRRERRRAKMDKAWIFMVRTRLPGGKLDPKTYLALDELCERRGNDTLRITTRQGFQFHGVGKENLGALIRELNEAYVTTIAACGDVARNIMAHPLSDVLPESPMDLHPLAQRLSRHFMPRTPAYFEVWLNGEKLKHFEDLPEPMTPIGLREGPEPIYGDSYLPRKFKIGLGWSADNHIDIYTQDIGIEVVPGKNGSAAGFNVLAGGGLGSTHGKSETYPRAADRFAFVHTEDEVVEICEAIVKVQRDYGDRTDRKHARLKYLIEEWGLDRFREEVEKMLGKKTEAARPASSWGQDYLLGWRKQRQPGKWALGVRVENGRIRDYEDGPRIREGLRAICREFPEASLRLSAHHNMLIANIDESEKQRIQEILREHNLSDGSDLSLLRQMEMACPALPTCGLALAESERYMPGLISEFEQAGYGDEDIAIRMTGCPNACARPWTAEIGIMGRAPGKYNIYLGGDKGGTRFSWLWRETVNDSDILSTLSPLIDRWRSDGKGRGVGFGDWCEANRETLLAEANGS